MALDFECIWRDWKEPAPLLPEGSVPHKKRDTHILSFRKLQEWQLLDAFTPTYLPIIFALKIFPLCHPVCTDLFSWNLIFHGSFSLQGLMWTFHFYPFPEGVKCIRTGDATAGGPSLFCAVLTVQPGRIFPPEALWALGLTQGDTAEGVGGHLREMLGNAFRVAVCSIQE